MPASVPPSYTRHARPSTNMPPQTKSAPRGALVFRGCVVVYARARARPTKRLPRLSSQSELPTFSPFSVASSLRSAHVVFGCLDGFRQRMYLESAARSFLLPFIDIGMDVTRLSEDRYTVAGQMILTLPGGPCMRCLGFLKTENLEREENEYGDAGINPQVVWTNGTLASLAVGAFVRLMTPWFPTSRGFEWLELDGDNQLVSRSRQPDYMASGPCNHFSNNELGDPFFQIPVQGETPK